MFFKAFLIILNCIFIIKINGVPIDPEFNYCEGLNKALGFYKAQRAGLVDPTSEYPWQHEITTKYDTYINNKTNKYGNGFLSKGYFDAGDYLKITFPLAFSMTTLSWSFLEFEENIKFCNLTESYLSTIKWGVDWLMAAHPEPNIIYAQCGGEIDHLSWSRADQIYNNPVTGPRNCSMIVNINNPSSDIAFEMVAAMASTSIVFEEFDLEYSKQCRKHADELWDFGIRYPGIYYNPMYPSNVSKDEQVWAAAWMYLMYGPEYSFYRGFFDNGKITHDDLFYNKWSHVFSWNNKMSAACILIAKNFNIYVDEANYLIHSWDTRINKTKDGLFFLDEWGNARYSMGGSFLEAVWNSNRNSTAKTTKTNFAQAQMNIILGNNSNHHSYVSMYGFKGAKVTLNIHHRSSHSPPNGTDLKFHNILSPPNNKYPIYGALLPGPIDRNDLYFEERSRYEMNEPALDYNAVFVGVLSSLINSKSKPVQPISSLTLSFNSDDYSLNNNNNNNNKNNETNSFSSDSKIRNDEDESLENYLPKPPIFKDPFDLEIDDDEDFYNQEENDENDSDETSSQDDSSNSNVSKQTFYSHSNKSTATTNYSTTIFSILILFLLI
ncbi:hypothetical protein RB653_001688 [Dictyostelium firmibasis]|uniref:cellulase n=1 Tax=Dictyostelium firmibasis TaxID=79012 RepID=A0AAN7U5G8_9MYCE